MNNKSLFRIFIEAFVAVVGGIFGWKFANKVWDRGESEASRVRFTMSKEDNDSSSANDDKADK